MRLAILSDTHGNLPGLEAVLTDMESYSVDGVVVAGDIASGGPQVPETFRWLRSLDAWMIRGNGDTALVRYDAGEGPAAWRTHRQFALLRWAHRHLDTEALAAVRALPEQRVVALPGTAAIRVVHGSPLDPAESIFPEQDPAALDRALVQVDEPVLIFGHTHIPWVQEQGERLTLNPGSTCGSLAGDPRAHYALLNWDGIRWQAELRAVPYDLSRVRAAFCESGLLEEVGALARCFLLSIETGLNVADDFLAHACEIAAAAGERDGPIISDEVWEQAAATFNWTKLTAG